MRLSDDVKAILLLVTILIGVLFLRKYLVVEAFESMTPKCGVGLAPCPVGTRCMNGYCLSDSVPPTRENDLPVFP
jgi:hypothetical protein